MLLGRLHGRSAQNPVWVYNLRANSRCRDSRRDQNGQDAAVQEVTEDPERWAFVVSQRSRPIRPITTNQAKTTRKIPLYSLRARLSDCASEIAATHERR